MVTVEHFIYIHYRNYIFSDSKDFQNTFNAVLFQYQYAVTVCTFN